MPLADDCPFKQCPLPRICKDANECMGRQPKDKALYRCTLCGGTYTKSRSDEEALAEAMRDFPGTNPEMVRPVCDECYQRVVEDMNVKRQSSH